MVRWKIWYYDENTDEISSFSNEDGEPWDAPAFGVQIITQEDDLAGRWNQVGDNYYVWRKDRWWGADIIGMFDYLANWKGRCVVRFGRHASNDMFQRVLVAAEEDKDFPKRSAWHKGEIRPK